MNGRLFTQKYTCLRKYGGCMRGIDVGQGALDDAADDAETSSAAARAAPWVCRLPLILITDVVSVSA